MFSVVHDWRLDFAIFGPNRQLVAIAEAKKKVNVGVEWATEWFRNYGEHQHSAPPPFILLVTPDNLYLWKTSADSPEPTAVVDARHIFEPYLERSSYDLDSLYGSTFESLVGAWLGQLLNQFWQPTTAEDVRLFVDTGLLEAIENGRVESDVAA
jgi:hypothetical protein